MKIIRLSTAPKKKPKAYRPSKLEIEQRALKELSTTNHIDAGAGFVLTDGTMLYFGSDDHRLISVALDELPEGSWEDPGSGSPKMIAFMDLAQALRVRKLSNLLAISLIHPATHAQIARVLETSAKRVAVDRLDKYYSTLVHEEYHLPEERFLLEQFLRTLLPVRENSDYT